MTPEKNFRDVIPRGGSRKSVTINIFGEELTPYQVCLMLHLSWSGYCRRTSKFHDDPETAIVNIIKNSNNNRMKKRYPMEYKIYYGIRTRTQNSSDKNYAAYGGAGITLCDKWSGGHGFQEFIRDMGPMPSHKKVGKNRLVSKWSVDRIDNNKGYSPDNCRWATDYDQRRNKRTNHWVVVDGERMCLSDACKKFGLKSNTVAERLRHGISDKDTVNLFRRVGEGRIAS